jgi:hypothetical protein
MEMVSAYIGNRWPDDTDGDGIPNFLDVDDDGDNLTTKLEITKMVPCILLMTFKLWWKYDCQLG